MSATAYYYFDFNDVEKQGWENLLRSLTNQLIMQLRQIPTTLKDAWIKCNAGKQRASIYHVRDILVSIMANFGRVYIMLDALDECTEQLAVLNWMKDTFSAHSNMHLLVASRRHGNIADYFKEMGASCVPIQTEDIDADIQSFIEMRLKRDAPLKRLPDAVRLEIMEKLMQKSKGM